MLASLRDPLSLDRPRNHRRADRPERRLRDERTRDRFGAHRPVESRGAAGQWRGEDRSGACGGARQVPVDRPDRHHADRHHRGCLFGRKPWRPGGRTAVGARFPGQLGRGGGICDGHRINHLSQPGRRRAGAEAGGIACGGTHCHRDGAPDGIAGQDRRAAGVAARCILRPADPPARCAPCRSERGYGGRTAYAVRRGDPFRRDRERAAPDAARRCAAGPAARTRIDDPAHRSRLDRRRCG